MRVRSNERWAAVPVCGEPRWVYLFASVLGFALACSSSDDGDTATVLEGMEDGSGRTECPNSESPEEDCSVSTPAPLRPAGGGMNPAGSESMPGPVGFVDGEPGGEAACAEQFVPATRRLPVIQFVVDTSGSMNWVPGTERAPQAGEKSKWQITQAALAGAIDAMPDDVAVGVVYYPNAGGDDDECYRAEVAAPIARLTPEHRELIQRVNAAEVPVGGTPTHAAYDFGVEQLETSDVDGARFLVLMTDGIPTFTRECSGDGRTRVDAGPLIAQVGDRLAASDIRTFVIGSPGSEAAREELSLMAFSGGTSAPGCDHGGAGYCHFDMTSAPDFSSALNTALGEITETTLACDFSIPAPPGRFMRDLSSVSVVLESNGTQVGEFLRSDSADCASGWQYGADETTIHLCGSTCDELDAQVRADPSIVVRVKVGCSVTPT